MYGPIEIKKIKHLATNFRLAIEKCDRNILFPTFRNFPKGSCGEATVLLAVYLEEQGYGIFEKALSCRKGWHHAWLQQGNLIVDITADQFQEIDQKVIVSLSSNWHRTFPEPSFSNCRSIFEDDEDWHEDRAKYAFNYSYIVSRLG